MVARGLATRRTRNAILELGTSEPRNDNGWRALSGRNLSGSLARYRNMSGRVPDDDDDHTS